MLRASLALVALFLLTAVALFEAAAFAQPTGEPSIEFATVRGDRRREIKSMDIHDRPNRPGHVYGNTVRRRATRNGVIQEASVRVID